VTDISTLLEETEVQSKKGKLSNFNKLWLGETVSYFGTQITNVAFPLTALVILHATAMELGIINALTFLPFLLFTLFIGVYVDRRSKKMILMTSNIARALLLLCIPIAYWFGLLSIWFMYVITFSIGIFTIAFDAAFQTFIPELIPTNQLVKANAKFISSSSTATVAGPGLGGYLTQIFNSVIAILINVFTFLFSAICIWKIDSKEMPIKQTQQRLNMKKDIFEGIVFILKHPYIRPITLEAATYNIFSEMIMTLILIYAKQDLHLSAGVIGLFFSFDGIGAILGSILTGFVVKKIGIGPATIISMVVACCGPLFILFNSGSSTIISIIIMIGFFFNGIGLGLSNVTCTTIRQTIIPKNILALSLTSSRLLTWGPIPIGALLSGWLGDSIGLRAALLVGVIGLPFAAVWPLASRLWKLKSVEEYSE
jgi:MFS family permease